MISNDYTMWVDKMKGLTLALFGALVVAILIMAFVYFLDVILGLALFIGLGIIIGVIVIGYARVIGFLGNQMKIHRVAFKSC